MIKKVIIHGCEARGDYDKPYLTRWILFKNKLNSFAIYLHKFHRSDADDLHDHPWDFVSIILWRGYNEITFKYPPNVSVIFKNKKRIYPFTIIRRKAGHCHRVELIKDKPAYTLVIRFKYVRYWGFWVKGKWQKFSEYFQDMGC